MVFSLLFFGVLGLMGWGLYALWRSGITDSIPIWMRYKEFLPSEFASDNSAQFFGLQARFGEIAFINKFGWVGWLNIQVGPDGIRFQNARGSIKEITALPPICIKWQRVESIQVIDTPQSVFNDSGLIINVAGWTDECGLPLKIAVYPSNVSYIDLKAAVLRFKPADLQIADVAF